jgi:hypothetical protein
MIIEWAEEHGAWRGRGQDHHYLIVADPDRGEVKLTRWSPEGENGLEDPELQALVNTVSLQAPRGPGRPPGEPEVAALVTQAREDCQLFEDGKRVPWAMACPAWRTRLRFTHAGVVRVRVASPAVLSGLQLAEVDLPGEEFDVEAGLTRLFRQMVIDGHLSEEHAEEALSRARTGMRAHGIRVQYPSLEDTGMWIDPPARQMITHGTITGRLPGKTGPTLGFETGEPFRSAAEHDWNESRGD